MKNFNRGIPVLCLWLLATGFLNGCAINPEILAESKRQVAATRSSELTCPQRETNCAIPSSLLERAATEPHRARILEYGEESLVLRLHLIRAARHSIDVQYFIFSADTSGRLLMHELLLAARRGVRVRVLFDQLFSIQDVHYLSNLARSHQNLDIRIYNPTFDQARTDKTEFVTGVACCFYRFNQRMHNKVFQADEKITILGGRNISDRYFDFDTHYNFIDRDVLISGPTASEISKSFEAYWNSVAVTPVYHLRDISKAIVLNIYQPPAAPQIQSRFASVIARAGDPEYITRTFTESFNEVDRIVYFWDLPRKASRNRQNHARATDTIFAALASSRSELLVQTPYMVLSRHLQRVYRDLLRKQPQPRIRYSTNSLASTDAWTAYALYHKKKKRYVQKLQIEIHELMPFPAEVGTMIPRYPLLIEEKKAGIQSQKFMANQTSPTEDRPGPRTGLHSKSIVIDRRQAIISSHNLDPRSEGFNTENGVLIDDPAFAEDLARRILRDMSGKNSWVVAARDDLVPLAADIGGVFEDISATLPVFDIWPFSYTTAFQLRPGGRETSPRDPRFYDNYIPVGRFPGVVMTRRQILTLMVGSMFGFLGPIM